MVAMQRCMQYILGTMTSQATIQTTILDNEDLASKPGAQAVGTSHIRSIITRGADGLPVEIECHLSNSLPNIVIVGAATRTVDEAKERIRAAFGTTGLNLPRKRISINLAPADIPKESSSLDLPIAIAILKQAGQLSQPPKHERHEAAVDGLLALSPAALIRQAASSIVRGSEIQGQHDAATRYFSHAHALANLAVARMIEGQMAGQEDNGLYREESDPQE